MNTDHPCFNVNACGRHGRIHLPVAPACNLGCGYCNRKYDCVNESRPGVTASLLSPAQACARAVKAVAAMPGLSVVGIAGPGDPLADPDLTIETLQRVRKALPRILLCLSSNGLALPDHAEKLAKVGVSHVTVTVNAVEPNVSAQIYDFVLAKTERLTGIAGAEYLLARQEEGIRRLARLGLTVKVNCVVIKGINDRSVEDVARAVSGWGAKLMNCIPLLPVEGTRLAVHGQPDRGLMNQARMQASAYLPQMRHCARCRADAIGLLAKETGVA